MSSFYPWTLPVLVANGFTIGNMQMLRGLTEGLPWLELALGSGGGIIAALIGAREVTRRDVL